MPLSHTTTQRPVWSFDLYDTLIMRNALSKEALYCSVWERLQLSVHDFPDCSTFITERSLADDRSKELDAPTLSDILDFLSPEISQFKSNIETVETAVELEQIRVIPGALTRLSHARRSGLQIAFISDMHIGAQSLRPRLKSIELLADDDWLLVSSDHGLSKARGGQLFCHLLEEYDVAASSVTHHGNSYWSDIKMARKHNISARFCSAANPTKYELSVLSKAKNCWALDSVASAIRDTRLTASVSDSHLTSSTQLEGTALVDVASSVAGPALVAFTLWAIERCKQQGITTVKFLTRDGELPLQIAKNLPTHITAGLNLDLLEVSRKSLLLPSASVIPLDKWFECGLEPGAFIAQHFDVLPSHKVLARVGLSFDLHASFLHEFGIKDRNTPLGTDGLEKLKSALQAPEIRDIIRQESLVRFKTTDAYLRQQLPHLGNQRVALIDIGWTGQQAAMLSALIRNQGGGDPLHLHVGRLRDRPLVGDADVDCWLFDDRHTQSAVDNPVALFESFCVSLAGGVDHYALDEQGTVKAIRRDQPHQTSVQSWGQPTLRQCVLDFARRAGADMHGIETSILRSTAETLLLDFWDHPSRNEAEKWGAFPYEQDQTGQAVKQLANPYTASQIFAKLKGERVERDWKAGSIELSSAPIKQLLKIHARFSKT